MAEFRMREVRPSLLYQPGRMISVEGEPVATDDNGQLQFHRARHVTRLLAPGNGFGKTACVSVENDWWIQGDHPYQRDEIPLHRPRLCIWLCQKYQQWEIMRGKIESWWTPGWEFKGPPHWSYTWAGLGELFIITAETDWQTIQGIEPDLVTIDETCPFSLWQEMQKRRRGNTRTRFIISATATDGLNWMHSDLYLPWRKFHEEKLGITDEHEMMRRQLHRYDDPALANLPGIWCWPAGSHRDNPTATAETWALYLQQSTGSAAERHVRLFGGFRDFAGSPVFDMENLEKMQAGLSDGITGSIIEVAA